MVVNQIYSILNSVCKQSNGEIAMQSNDLTGLIALGDTVLSSANTKDVFLNVLVDVIGRTIMSNKPYSVDNYVLTDYFTYSATLQKIYVDPLEARENPEYSLVDGESIDQYIVRKPTAKQKIFSKKSTFEIDVTIPDDSLSSAFRTPEDMSAFIDSIMQAVENTMQVEIENLQLMAIDNMIGETLHSGKETQKVNLLKEYNTLHSATLSVDAALTNVDFLKFATTRINETRKRMRKMSVLFNTEGSHKHTPDLDLKVLVLDEFEDSVISYLQADTYHNEMVQLNGSYNTIPYWQAPGQDYLLSNTSKVDITTSSGHPITQTGIVAMLFDKDAIFATYTMEKTESARNARGRYVNYFFKYTKQYANDLSENCVVFYLAA